MRINNKLQKRRLIRRRRRIIILRSALLLAFLAGVVLLIIFVFNRIKTATIPDKYDQSSYERIVSFDQVFTHVDGFAEEIAVVNEVILSDDLEYIPETGFLCEIGGKEALFSKNAFKRMNPASTTKIMTAMLALKYGNLKDRVDCGNEVTITEAGASLAGLKPGDSIVFEQLLYGLMLPSGNDAANAVAVKISGSVDRFVELMNEEAYNLGCRNTNFVNANGLTDQNHYSSAYDLYLMINEALKYDKFREITGTKSYTADWLDKNGKAVRKTWSNGNKFLSDGSLLPQGIKVVSGKTGTTIAAGRCLVLVTETENEKEYISIVLNAKTRDILYGNMKLLLEKIE